MGTGVDLEMLECCLATLGVYGEARTAIIAIVEATARPAMQPYEKETEKLGVIAGNFLSKSLMRKRFVGSVADDPAWNMLLAIFEAQSTGRSISISETTIASEIAGTTALRHIAYLENRNILSRRQDQSDLRRTFVEMPAAAYDRMASMIRGFCVAPPTRDAQP